MKEALDKLLELKLAKRAAKDTLLHFDFYLQPQVLNVCQNRSNPRF